VNWYTINQLFFTRTGDLLISGGKEFFTNALFISKDALKTVTVLKDFNEGKNQFVVGVAQNDDGIYLVAAVQNVFF